MKIGELRFAAPRRLSKKSHESVAFLRKIWYNIDKKRQAVKRC